MSGREYLHCDDDCGNQIQKCFPDPHQGPCTLLVLKRRQTEKLPRGQVGRVDEPVRKRQECRKNVTR
jgi:hypothetical protein